MLYNYNGHKVLEFPKNLDTSKYPFLWLMCINGTYPYYILQASDLPFTHHEEMVTWHYKCNTNDSDLHFVTYEYHPGNNFWSGPSQEKTWKPGDNGVGTSTPWIWSNYDVLYCNSSTVWQKTYEPIPISYVRIVDPLNLYTIQFNNSFGFASCLAFVEGSASGNRWAWTAKITGNTSSQSRILRSSETDCMFTIFLAPDEKATSIEITVTSIEDETVSASQTFSVVSGNSNGGDSGGSGGGDSGDIEPSLITNIELFIQPDELVPGGHAVASVIVSGTGEYNQDFTVEISGSNSLKTCFIKGIAYHNIWVGEDETAEFILVTVTSVQDPSMSETEMIYIDHSGTTVDPGATVEQLQRAYWNGYSAAKALYGR